MTEKPAKVRMNDDQKDMLVNYMLDNPILVTKKFSNTFTYQDGERKWNEIITKLNKIGPVKDKEAWKKSWRALKLSAKKAAGEVRQSTLKTGGGSSDEEDLDLTPTKERVIAISGGQTVVKGNTRVSTFPVLLKTDYRPAPKLEAKLKPNDTNSDEEDDVEVIGLPQIIHHAEVHQEGDGNQESLVIPKRKLDFNNDEKLAKVLKRAKKEEQICTQKNLKRHVESKKPQTYESLINLIEVVEDEDDVEIVPNKATEEKVLKPMRHVENVEIEKLPCSTNNTSKKMSDILPNTPVNNSKLKSLPSSTSEKNGQSAGKSTTYNKKKDSSANSEMMEVIKQQTEAIKGQTAAIIEQTKVFGQFSGLLQDLLNRL